MLKSLCSSLTRRSYYRRSFVVVQQVKAYSSRKAPDKEDTDDEDFFKWIPPNRPLVGDKGNYETQDGEEDTTITNNTASNQSSSSSVDWLATRRSKQSALTMGLPGKGVRFAGAELEVLPGVLLSSREIEQCLTAMGGTDYLLLASDDEDLQRRMGNANGVILVTATSTQHLAVLAQTLIRQLKQRNLNNFGVSGAKRSSKRSRRGNASNGTDDWEVVDCANYVVNIMLKDTRRHLNIEAIWSGEDDLFYLDYSDEKAVDDYVARNPVPDEYGAKLVEDSLDDVTDSMISRLEKFNDMKQNIKTKKPVKS